MCLLLLLCVLYADAFKRLLKSTAAATHKMFHFILVFFSFSFLCFAHAPLQLVLTLFKQHLLLSLFLMLLLNIFLNAVACRIIFISLKRGREREIGKAARYSRRD